ncbi:MAG: nitroreductase family protein [Nitrososphaerota archaeon]|nr:nitroreductase family protein [Nitrososphaerota archaeon]
MIKQRRSIRRYQTKPVPKEIVQKVLEAATWAPSAHNSQPWQFIILEDRQIKRNLTEQMSEAWASDLANNNQSIDAKKRKEKTEQFTNAPVLILVCLTPEGLKKFSDKTQQSIERDLAIESLGACIQNLLLATHATGLGACWYCAPAFCKELVQKILKIPKSVEPHAFITLGYPDEVPTISPRKKESTYYFVNFWGNTTGQL